jgi:hypothetical protein
MTEQNCDWIRCVCVDCSKWLHELCTVYGDRCNSCGKQFIRKEKKLSEATHPPTVGHLNTTVGRDGQKRHSEKM